MKITVNVERVIDIPEDKAVIYQNLNRAMQAANAVENWELGGQLDRQMYELLQDHAVEMISSTPDFFLHQDADVTYQLHNTDEGDVA